ncbi:ribosomal L1 domain-containing protein 1 isoform 2-T2 [Anomaloglossus baeobatrachus]
MSVEQTEKFYKKLLSQHGVKQITEVIPLKKMKKEYKPYEAKRRLLGSYDLFLADSRIRRLLPSHIGKHFYKEKREPLSVNLKHKYLANELNRFIQGTQLHITNRGCCYSIRVGHTGMKVDDIAENILAVSQVVAEKLPMKWKNVKLLHLKTQSSVALPIYNSSFDSLNSLGLLKTPQAKKKKKKQADKKTKTTNKLEDEKAKATTSKKQKEADSGEEEIPILVPIPEPISAKKSKKKKSNIPKVSIAVKASQGSTENIQVSSTKKPTPKKRKINDSEEVNKIPSKHKNKRASEEKSKKPEELETPPRRSILKKTPKKTPAKPAAKLTKSARKAPQTPKLKQKKKMKTPQSV